MLVAAGGSPAGMASWASVYNRHLSPPRGAVARASVVAAMAAVLVGAGALPAQAHTTGPQLISHADGISPPAPGVHYSLLSTGSAPYVTVSLGAGGGSHTFEIRGLVGEPFIRLTSAGVDLNRNSPSLYLTRDPSKKQVSLPATVSPTPSWERVADQPSYHYYETRAEWPHTGQPDEARRLGRTAVVYRFSIPAAYDGQPAAIEGHVTWIPAPINLEIPLLFVPLLVVGLLWIEPKAKPHVAGLARALVGVTALGAAIEAGRVVLDLQTVGRASAGLAPAAVLVALGFVVLLALPRVVWQDRRAYVWVLLMGLALLLSGLLRPVAAGTPHPSIAEWLRRADIVAGFAVTAGAGLLVFLSSPTRAPGRPARTYGARGRSASGGL